MAFRVGHGIPVTAIVRQLSRKSSFLVGTPSLVRTWWVKRKTVRLDEA